MVHGRRQRPQADRQRMRSLANDKAHPPMATPQEFESACPDCDRPGVYVIQGGHRLRTGVTSNLSRFVRRQRAPARILYVARLEVGEATHAWRSLLSSLRARGLTPKECQFEAGAARDVAQGMLGAVRRESVLTASEIHRRAQRFHSQDRGESVASTRLESPDNGPRSKLVQDQLPPTFRQLLGEIGADD